MTETEWLTCDAPRLMLEQVRNLATPRQLRCFACACVREVWPLLLDRRSQIAVEVAERFVDGLASRSDLLRADQQAFEVTRQSDLRSAFGDPAWAATRAAARVANLEPFSAASGAAFIAALSVAPWGFDASGAVLHHGDHEAKRRARVRQCELLREILGNPYRPVTLEPDWLAWDDGTPVRLARDIYDGQRYHELPVLADALEEAGCTSEEVLSHCRSPQIRHVRGCWVLDLVLGLR